MYKEIYKKIETKKDEIKKIEEFIDMAELFKEEISIILADITKSIICNIDEIFTNKTSVTVNYKEMKRTNSSNKIEYKYLQNCINEKSGIKLYEFIIIKEEGMDLKCHFSFLIPYNNKRIGVSFYIDSELYLSNLEIMDIEYFKSLVQRSCSKHKLRRNALKGEIKRLYDDMYK